MPRSMPPTFLSQCCQRETYFCARSYLPQSHELLEKRVHLSLALLLPLASPCLNSVGTLLMSRTLKVRLRSGSLAALAALYNLFGQQRCYSQIENLAPAAIAMRSVGRRAAAVLLFVHPAAALVAVVD